VGVVVILIDRYSFVPKPETEPPAEQATGANAGNRAEAGKGVDEERELHRAELAACRHALAEYDIVTYLVTAGDDLGAVLGQRTRVRA
jgi:hypothetical protein